MKRRPGRWLPDVVRVAYTRFVVAPDGTQYELTARRKRDVVEPGAGLAVEFLPAGIQLLWLAVRESSLDEKYRGLWIVAEGHRFHELDTIAEVSKAEALDLVDRRVHELATIRGF